MVTNIVTTVLMVKVVICLKKLRQASFKLLSQISLQFVNTNHKIVNNCYQLQIYLKKNILQ